MTFIHLQRTVIAVSTALIVNSVGFAAGAKPAKATKPAAAKSAPAAQAAKSSPAAANAGSDSREKNHEEVNLSSVQTKKREKSDEASKAQGPSISRGEAFVMATEGKLSSEIKKAISFYEKTERTLPAKSSARLQMLERLVNLYLENAVYEANAEFRKYDRAFEAWTRAGGKGKAPIVDNRVSKGVWKQVASKSAYVLKEFPRTKIADELMFNQAISLQYLGQEKDSARIYTTLIQKFPNSNKAGEAYFQLGDFFFSKQDFRNAIIKYKEALKYKTSRGYGWSLFQLGWCEYNLGNYQNSLAYWQKTVASASRGNAKGNDQLKEEGLKDMIYAWIEVRQVDQAISYYKTHGGEKYIGKFLNRLASQLVEIGRYNEAIAVYKRYQSIYPNADDTPDAQKEVISLYFELSKFPLMWKELEALPKMYGPTSGWAQANKEDKQAIDETQVMIRDQLIYYAKVLHKAGQKDDNSAAYREALRGYVLYLKNYPHGKEMPEVKYLMADIFFAEKKFRESGKLYQEIAELGKDKAVVFDPQTKKANNIHSKVSRYMLDSYGLDFEPEYKVLLKLNPEFDKKPRKLSPRATSYVLACRDYIKWYPEDKKSVKECDIYTTAIYYRNSDKEHSKKLLFNLAQKYPNEKIGPEAVEWLIPLYGKDTKALVAIAENLLKVPAYQKGKLGDKLRELKRGAEIDEINKIADLGKRAKAYEDQSKRNPSASDADRLMYNAAVDYVKAGMIANAIVAYSTVVKTYPKSEAFQDSLLQMAKLSDKRFEWANASAYYLAFAQRYPKDKASVPAIGRACELEVAGGLEKAVQTCLMLAKFDEEGAKGFIDKMVRDAEYAKNYAKMQQLFSGTYLKFRLSPEEKIIAWHRIYNAANGNGQAAQQAAQQMLASYKQSGGKIGAEASRYIGELVFRNVNGVMAKFSSLKLAGGTVDALAGSIQKKAGMILQVDKAYNEVLGTKDAYWGVAALYQLGFAREQLANDLENPPGITGAPIEDVKKQLAPQAAAAKAEAKKWYQTAVESIGKFSVYNEWSGRSVSGLARLNGQKLSYEDVAIMPDFIGSDVPLNVLNEVQPKGGD
ncbi:MAG: tetratricopeptide repeat protein [Proteobacteria bacterium]|nr:tetratricopeptide repeat protein [Pseudomonadota bacterium]